MREAHTAVLGGAWPIRVTFPSGFHFGTGVDIAIVTNASALDNTAAAAGDIVGLMIGLASYTAGLI